MFTKTESSGAGAISFSQELRSPACVQAELSNPLPKLTAERKALHTPWFFLYSTL